MVGIVKAFKYAAGVAPSGYECAECGAKGVRLYRYYQTFLECQTLRCRACAVKHAGEEPDTRIWPQEHCIGSMVSAVPTEDGRTYWGYTSVPEAGVSWWNNLPKTPNAKLTGTGHKCPAQNPQE